MRRRKRTEVLGMRSIKEIFRLTFLGRSQVEISQACNISRATVQDYQNRGKSKNLNWKDIEKLSEEEVLNILGKKKKRAKGKVDPDFEYIHQELSRKEVTLERLWVEYLNKEPKGYSYSGFCVRYRDWKESQKLSMRQVHKAGEKFFVDYTGVTIPIYDRTGEILYKAEIFTGCMGASNYIYAEATKSQQLYHWIGSHVRAFEFLGGVPEIIVPDNLKSGVQEACRYEPELNPTYQDFATHYDVVIIPTRVRKPKDKAKVENAVQNVERRILAVFRDRKFYSIEDLNEAIKPLLVDLNNRVMKTYGKSRRELFELLDKPELKSLPIHRYEFSSYKYAKVNIDYHIEVDRHYYSVPHKLRGEKVEIVIKEKIIDIFHNHKKVVSHLKSNKPYSYTTIKEHLPESHQAMLGWSPSRFLSWSEKIGHNTVQQVSAILNSRKHPEQSYRSVLGLLRLAKKYGEERLENACKRANSFSIISMRGVRNILETKQDLITSPEQPQKAIPEHENIRGQSYYH